MKLKFLPAVKENVKTAEFWLQVILWIALIILQAAYPKNSVIQVIVFAIISLIIWLIFRVSGAKGSTKVIEKTE